MPRSRNTTPRLRVKGNTAQTYPGLPGDRLTYRATTESGQVQTDHCTQTVYLPKINNSADFRDMWRCRDHPGRHLKRQMAAGGRSMHRGELNGY